MWLLLIRQSPQLQSWFLLLKESQAFVWQKGGHFSFRVLVESTRDHSLRERKDFIFFSSRSSFRYHTAPQNQSWQVFTDTVKNSDGLITRNSKQRALTHHVYISTINVKIYYVDDTIVLFQLNRQFSATWRKRSVRHGKLSRRYQLLRNTRAKQKEHGCKYSKVELN